MAITVQFVVPMVESSIIVAAGFICLGFGGSRWTAPYVERYIGLAVANGVKIMLLHPDSRRCECKAVRSVSTRGASPAGRRQRRWLLAQHSCAIPCRRNFARSSANLVENLSDRLSVPPTGDQLQRLSETLDAMFSRLDAAVRRIKQFTADALHELRAPVSLIGTTAEVAVQKTNRTPQEYFEALQEILAESERTSQVVDSLMLLARADSGTETLESGDADASNIAREAADQGEQDHGLAFAVRLPDPPVPIEADSNALRRALLNLIDNAVKYTRKGGSVKVDLETNKDFAVVSVSDTGIGIAKADIPHIFDRFWRADKARSREEGGAGLGLSIAK